MNSIYHNPYQDQHQVCHALHFDQHLLKFHLQEQPQFQITHTIVNNIVLNIDRDNISNRFLLECVTIFCIIIGFSTPDFRDVKHSPMLDGLHSFPRFTQFGILKVKNLSRLTRKYKRVIFISLTWNINACVVCISFYHSPSTIGISIVPFTLEQNNFMAKHLL